MAKFIALLLIGGLTLLPMATVRAAPDPAEKSSDKEDLVTAIKKGIELLDAKKYTEFLERYMLPDDLAKFKKSATSTRSLPISKEHAEVMVKILKGLQGLKPEMSEDAQSRPLTSQKLEGPHPDKLQFRQVKDVWYIADK